MSRKSHTAFCYKDTFWNKKRIEQNIKVKEISELLGCPYSTAGAYFSGLCIPEENDIKTLCEFFGVDIILGQREFINAHKEYDALQKRELKYSARKKPTKTTPISKHDTFEKIEETKPINDLPKLPTDITSTTNKTPINDEKSDEDCFKDITKELYGKLSFDDYNEFMRLIVMESNKSALKFIYGKIDFDTFLKITKRIEQK